MWTPWFLSLIYKVKKWRLLGFCLASIWQCFFLRRKKWLCLKFKHMRVLYCILHHYHIYNYSTYEITLLLLLLLLLFFIVWCWYSDNEYTFDVRSFSLSNQSKLASIFRLEVPIFIYKLFVSILCQFLRYKSSVKF